MKTLLLITSILFSFSIFASSFKIEISSSWIPNEGEESKRVEIIEADSDEYIYRSSKTGGSFDYKLNIRFHDVENNLLKLKVIFFEYRNGEEFVLGSPRVFFKMDSNAEISMEDSLHGLFKMNIRLMDIHNLK